MHVYDYPYLRTQLRWYYMPCSQHRSAVPRKLHNGRHNRLRLHISYRSSTRQRTTDYYTIVMEADVQIPDAERKHWIVIEHTKAKESQILVFTIQDYVFFKSKDVHTMIIFFFFFNDPAPPEISPLPQPGPLPI